MPTEQPSLRDSVINERVVAPHPAYTAVELTIRSPDGSERTKPAIRHRGAVCVLPLLESQGEPPRVVLIRNDRIIANTRLWELCAGGIDGDEAPIDAATRELVEETGYAAADFTPLGSFYTSPGMSDEVMHAFFATGLTPEGQQLEPWENISVHTKTIPETLEMIDRGEIRDGKSITILLLALRRGYLDPKHPAAAASRPASER